MKNKYIIFLLLLTAFSFSACIQDEAPNAECDILDVDTTYTWFKNNKEILAGDFKVNNDNVVFTLTKDADFNSIEISHESIIEAFILTPGARIEKNNMEINKDGIFLYFTVHSEDGLWKKLYTIKFIKVPPLDIDHLFGFENVETNIFDNWHEINTDGIRSDIWASGNPGFKMSGEASEPKDYPTISYEDGFVGRCVKLTTRSTGDFGKKAKMPIAAGSIFIGDFNSASAMLMPLKATRFGKHIIPEKAKPVKLTGYYKYTPGEIFTNKKEEEIVGRRDICDIYAVLFEADASNFKPLDGSNIKTSDRIVLLADLQNPEEPTKWKRFEIPFEEKNGKIFDYDKLANNEYAITIVASSSKDGAIFEGAVGSTLLIDELKIEWEQK